MRDASSRERAGSRYETFVVRLWVEHDGAIEHGEIRHVGSNAAKRFREIGHALSFITSLVGPPDSDAELTPD